MHYEDKRTKSRWAGNAETARYLNVSQMTLWRWKRNPQLKFPAAAVINGREHNDLHSVDEWMRAHTVRRLVSERRR